MVSTIDSFTFNPTDVIGKSNYGKVYRGYSQRTQEVVAVKEIPKKYLEHKFYNTVFNNEVSALRKIKSPHVVKFMDLKMADDKFYLIMEYCDGGDLGEFLTKRRRLPENEVMVMLNDLVEGLKELKRCNVLHRDLKPANILMKNGKIKIADLGYSKPVQNYMTELFTSYVGSPLYMSPQILFKQNYTTKADIWSFGVILYQLITGEVPWDSSDIPRLQASVANRVFYFRPEIPISADLKDLIVKCIAYEECDRISWDELFNHPAVLRAKPQLTQALYNSFAGQPRLNTTQNLVHNYATTTPQAKTSSHSNVATSPAKRAPQTTFTSAVKQANALPRTSAPPINHFSPASSTMTPGGTPQQQRQMGGYGNHMSPVSPMQNPGPGYFSPVLGGGMGGYPGYPLFGR